jgi:hypothetical protein
MQGPKSETSRILGSEKTVGPDSCLANNGKDLVAKQLLKPKIRPTCVKYIIIISHRKHTKYTTFIFN